MMITSKNLWFETAFTRSVPVEFLHFYQADIQLSTALFDLYKKAMSSPIGKK